MKPKAQLLLFLPRVGVSCVCVSALAEFEVGGQIQQLTDMMEARSSKAT